MRDARYVASVFAQYRPVGIDFIPGRPPMAWSLHVSISRGLPEHRAKPAKRGMQEGMSSHLGSLIPRASLSRDGEDRRQSSFGTTYLEEFAPLLSWSTKATAVRRVIEKVAGTDAAVLLRGESGVGKDFVARAIHAASSRHAGPFVKVNCAGLPAELLESELFGYEKGAFTGAYRRKPGKFEFANRGTICLDEIGEVPRLLQSKLLHVLQDFQFARIGGRETI